MKITSLFVMLMFSACAVHKQDTKVTHTADAKAVSDLHSASIEKMAGLITIEDLKSELKITAEISGLTPNTAHGFHIHQKGICEGPDYKSAGDHFNPYSKPHGKPGTLQRHIGDMGNLVTNEKGEAKKVIILPKAKEDDLSLIIGKSILVHAEADDLKTQPSGDSGGRIACGLIKPVN